jgi:RHS repeat-associated protein
VSATVLKDGDVTGIDPSGRPVNTASFSGTGQRGWKITTTEYDTRGNTIRALSAGNRERAVYDTANTYAALGLAVNNTQWLSRMLDQTTIYSSDGIDALETFGPYHPTLIPGGSTVMARAHAKTTYGTRLTPNVDPTVEGPIHHAVQVTSGASQSPDATATSEVDQRTVQMAYALSTSDTSGWLFQTPVRVTQVIAGGTNIVRETVLDPATGLTVQQRQPSAAGQAANPGTRLTSYYTATGTGPCVNPAFLNLPCQVKAGADPTTVGLAKLPVTTYTYDYLYRPTTIAETVVDAAGATQTRTTTTTYENAGLSPRLIRGYTSGTVGTAVPAVVTSYDPVTGLPTTVATDTTPAPGPGMAGTITTGYDDFGRATTTTDADNATSTQTYDSAGRPSTTTWTKPGGAVLGTRTTAYNTASDRRGLPSTATDSGVTGSFTATYDADGNLVGQTYPNGLIQAVGRDYAGQVVDLSDTQNGVGWHHGTVTRNIYGQQITNNAQWAYNRGYTYDGAARLASATFAWVGGSTCEKNSYTFDTNGNRLTKTRISDNGTGTCVVNQAISNTYDNADRLTSNTTNGTTASPTYDAWGRITTLPAQTVGNFGNGSWNTGGNLTNSYYVTDAAASQTQAGTADTWTLDPAGRRRVANLAGTSKTNHYSGSTDNPSWIDEGGTAGITRYIPDLSGQPAISLNVATTTTTTYNVINIHGDIDMTSSPAPVGNIPDGHGYAADDYGNPYSSIGRYTWLGAAQRSDDALGATVLMGARSYNPNLGRFLTTDPVYGGNENAYTYPNDPVNQEDISGKVCWKCYLVSGIAFGLQMFLGGSCVLGTALFLICRGAVGAVVGAAKYLVTQLWALGRSFTWDMLAYAAIQGVMGFLGGITGGVFNWKTFLKANWYLVRNSIYRAAAYSWRWLWGHGYYLAANAVIRLPGILLSQLYARTY